MTTRTYTDLLSLIQALCGVAFAAIELPRIQALVNRRATRAYRATNYWPRFLTVGEERTVTSGVVPFTQTSLSNIDTFLHIHVTEPYTTSDAQEYDYMVTGTGAVLVCGSSDPTTAFVTYKSTHTDIYGNGATDEPDVPAEWFDYLAHGAYADWLRSEGQQEKAIAADMEAADMLTDETMRVDEQGTTQLISTKFRTNSNMQTR